MPTYAMSGSIPQSAKYVGEFVPSDDNTQYSYRVIAYDRTSLPITNTDDPAVSAYGPIVLDGNHAIRVLWSIVVGASFYQVFKGVGSDPGSTTPWYTATASETEILDVGYPASTRSSYMNPGASPTFAAGCCGNPASVATNVPVSGMAPPDDGHQGGGYVRMVGTVGATSAGSQTPWLSNIDAAGYNLGNLGDVGIGLPAQPGYPLFIYANNPSNASLFIQTNNGPGFAFEHQELSPNSSAGIVLANDAGSIASFQQWGSGQGSITTLSAPSNLLFRTNSTTRATINVNGNFGIGISNPAYPLDVNGNINVTGQYLVNGVPITAGGGSQTPWLENIDAANFNLSNVAYLGVNQAAATAGRVNITTTGNEDGVGVYSNASGASSTKGAYVTVYNSTGTWASFECFDSTSAVSPNCGAIDVASGHPFLIRPGGAEIARFIATGVGIGGISPQHALDVNGDCNISGTYRVNGVPISIAGAQTPWTSNIDGAGFNLTNVSQLSLGTPSVPPGTSRIFTYTINPTTASIYVQTENTSTYPGFGIMHQELNSAGGAGFIAVNDAGNALLMTLYGSASPGGANAALISANGPFTIVTQGNMLVQGGNLNVISNTGSAYTDLGLSGANLSLAAYGSMEFLTGPSGSAASRMYIAQGGNVGIGTNGPNYTLDVNGTTNSSGGFVTAGNYVTAVGNGFTWSDYAWYLYSTGGNFYVRDMVNGVMAIACTPGSSPHVGIGLSAPAYPLHVLAPAPSTQVAIQNYTGTVGTGLIIGDGSRSYFLGINLIGAVPGEFQICDASSGNCRIAVTSTGNVGIGTTAPAYALDILGPIANSYLASFKGTGNQAFLQLDTTATPGGTGIDFRAGGVWQCGIGPGSGGGFAIWTMNATNPFFIDANSNVGIQLTPAYPLDVAGKVRSLQGSFILDGPSATNKPINFQTNTLERWTIFVDAGAESGSNAGSNFNIWRYDDSGNMLSPAPLAINRATGNMTLAAVPLYSGLAQAQAALGNGTKVLWVDPSNVLHIT